jgi:hypothetical protein
MTVLVKISQLRFIKILTGWIVERYFCSIAIVML